MSNGAATYPDNDWVHRAAEYYIVRAENHCSHAPATSARIIFPWGHPHPYGGNLALQKHSCH